MPRSLRADAVLTYWSRTRPDARALTCGATSMTWRELDGRVASLAAGLHGLGVRAGDRVGFLSTNSVAVVETILAALRLDCVVVPLNVRLAVPELAWVLSDAGISTVLTDAAFGATAQSLHEQFPLLRMVWEGPSHPSWVTKIEDLRDERPTDINPESIDIERPAFICYTSGTTGHPKGAVLTHTNVLAAAEGIARLEQLSASDVCLLVLPLAFTGSCITTLLPAYVSGAETVLHSRFDVAQVMAELDSGRISVFYAVPFVWEEIARQPGWPELDLSRLRIAKAGGAPVSHRLLAAYAQRGVFVAQGYGMTESGGVGISMPREDAWRKSGTTGLPLLGTEVRVVADDGTDCPTGVVGELWLRGPSVMSGYWNNAAATEEALRYGWLHTGDLGSRDEDGFVTITGRKKEMLISGGLNVYPGEIERVIAALPGVDDVAVVGVPDPRWGESPVAFVVTAAVTEAAVRAACWRELADYKVPKRFVIRTEPLPRLMSGKVAQRELRALL